MRKLILVLVFCLSFCSYADAQFFFGMKFGLYTDFNNTSVSEQDGVIKGGRTFNYSIKPSIGYYFTPDLIGGIKFEYVSNNFYQQDTGTKTTSIKYMLLNVLMGNGLDTNCMKWNIAPYLRYRLFSAFSPKINFWAEFDAYVGGKYERDKVTKEIDPATGRTLWGVEIHPLISVDLLKNWMLYSSLDILSIGYEGSWAKSVTSVEGDKQNVDKYTGAFLFQANPLIGIANSIVNIGIIKKF